MNGLPQCRIAPYLRIVLGCWAAFLVGTFNPSWAQHAQRPQNAVLDVRDATLDEALQRLIAVTRIDVAYANALVAGKRTTCTTTAADPETALACILAGQGLTYERLASGAYVIKTAPPDTLRPSSQPGPVYGTITGVVLEQTTNRPLAGAHVVVAGTQRGVASGPDGHFEIGRIQPGLYTLDVSMIGYETTQAEPLRVADGTATEVRLVMQETRTPLREIVVMPGHFSLLHRQPAVHQTLTREELLRRPALGDDVYRAVQRLPGVSGNDFSAKFTVRGGAYEEVLVRLDGMELYEPFHLKDVAGGLFSIIDTEAIEGVEMMTGAFPVEYGNRLSGVFDIQSSVPSLGQGRTSLGLSLSNLRFLSEGRFGAGKGQWLAVARRGYLDLLLKLVGEDETFEPRYYDIYTKVQYQVHPKHTVSAHVLSADDQTRYFNDADFSLDGSYGNTYGWSTWNALLTPRLWAQTTLSVGRITRNRTGIDYFADGGGVVFRVADRRSFTFYGLKQDWTYEHGDRYVLKAGFDAKRLTAAYDYENQVRLVEVPTSPFDTTRVVLHPAGTTLAAYAGARVRLTEAFTAEGGVRYEYASWPGDRHLGPRLNLAYALGPRTALRAGWGWFYQSQGIHEMDVQDGDDAFHPAQRAKHRTIGLEHTFANGIQMRLEAYQKRLSNLRPAFVNLPYDVIYSFPEAERGRVQLFPERGEARGVEVFVQRETAARFTWWAGYTLAFAEDTIEGAGVRRHFDQRHTLQFDLGYRPGRNWDLHVAWLFHSGWPYTPSTLEPVTTPDGTYFATVPGPVNSAQLPPYHRLDLRVSRHFAFSHSRLSIFLDIQNLYNRDNVRLYLPTHASVGPDGVTTVHTTADYFLPLLPSFGIRWDLFH